MIIKNMDKELYKYLPNLADLVMQYNTGYLKRVMNDIKFYNARARINHISLIAEIRQCEWDDNKTELYRFYIFRSHKFTII